jgi:hypothetical protein
MDGDNGSCTVHALGNWDRGKSISTYIQVGRIKYVVGTVIQFSFACHQYVACRSFLSGSNTSNHPPYRIMYLSDNRNTSPLITS